MREERRGDGRVGQSDGRANELLTAVTMTGHGGRDGGGGHDGVCDVGGDDV